MVKIRDITIDEQLQSRVAVSQDKIGEYAELMEEDIEFTPVEIIDDGKKFYLWDGFHRFHAAVKAKLTTIPANVKKGTYREAFLLSLGANANHGLPLSNADKRLKVKRALGDVEIALWSDAEIAKVCGVTRMTVWRIRKEQTEGSAPAAKPQPKPQAPAPVAEAPEEAYDEREEFIKDLAAEVESLKGQLAVTVLPEDKRAEAAEYLEQLKADNELLRQKLDAVTISRDQYMAENAQLKKQVAMLQKKLKAQS